MFDLNDTTSSPSTSVATSSSTQHELIATMFGGALSGIIGRTILHPIDTIKAVTQVKIRSTTKHTSNIPNVVSIQQTNNVTSTEHQLNNMKQMNGGQTVFKTNRNALQKVFDVWRHLYATDGLKGLYRGYTITVVGSVPGTAIYFAAYESARQLLHSNTPLKSTGFGCDFIAGFMAEVVSCLIFIPIDVCKERLQSQNELKVTNYKNGMDALRQIMQKEGITQLYKGYGAALAAFGPFSAFYFMIYEKLKEVAHYVENHSTTPVMGEPNLSTAYLLMSAATAGAAAAFITTPMDMVKMRIQVQRNATLNNPNAYTPFLYRHFGHGLHTVLKTEGIRGCFSGAVARMLFHTPNTAITITMMEKLRQWYLHNIGR